MIEGMHGGGVSERLIGTMKIVRVRQRSEGVINAPTACASVLLLLFATMAVTDTRDWNQALLLYERTDYRSSLKVLSPIVRKNAPIFCLMGRDYFMMADYKKAIQALSKATAMEPGNADCVNWLGRAYGRQAQTGSVFTAFGYASKARQMFEKAAALDPSNKRATGDLLRYYLTAPEVLGGGIRRAEELAVRISQQDPADGHFAQAQIEEERHNYNAAEKHLRLARDLDPTNPRRLLDLAILLAKMGQFTESESQFTEAASSRPVWPELAFERASTYIEARRNLEQARSLLQQYLRAQLSPDDPPRQEAEALLEKIKSCCP